MNSEYSDLTPTMKHNQSIQPSPILWICIFVLACSTIACNREVEVTTSLDQHKHQDRHTHFIPLAKNSDMELEFLASNKRNQLELHVLDAETHEPHSIDSPNIQATFHTSDQNIPVTFVASPLKENRNPQSSRFVLPFDELPQQLKLLNDFQITFTLELDGQQDTGRLDHKNDHQHHHE